MELILNTNDGILSGMNILVMGARNKWSIATGIAQAAHAQGANIIITYQGDREKPGASQLKESLEGTRIYQCDVSSDSDLDHLFEEIRKDYGVIHGMAHCIANAKPEDLKNNFVSTSRVGFAHAMDVSVYSFIGTSNRAKDLMTEGGSIITLSYVGSEKVLPGYNVMGVAKAALEASTRYMSLDLGELGIRVNTISPGPIKTISAKGVKNFNSILETVEKKAPLKRNVQLEEIGETAVFLLSRNSRAITGEVIYVDCGYNIMGI